MKLQLYNYACLCGNVFKAPHLLGEPYGEFLLRSEIDELIYLNTFKTKEFDELSDILRDTPKLKDKNNADKADILLNLFSLVCDPSPKNKIYFIQKLPNCPECQCIDKIDSWTAVYPYEIVNMNIKEVTCGQWDQLNKDEKKIIIIDK